MTAFKEVENAMTNERLWAEQIQIQEAEVKSRTESVRVASIQI